MLRTSNSRSKSEQQTLKGIKPYIEELKISGVNNISISEEIDCYTYEIRKRKSISGYLNLGKGYEEIGAKVSGLMEAIEVSVIEMTAPSYWYSKSCFKDLKRNKMKNKDRKKKDTTEMYVYGENMITTEPKKQKLVDIVYQIKNLSGKLEGGKNKTNGLASGNNIEEATTHALYELIERHQMTTKRIEPLGKIVKIEESSPFREILEKTKRLGIRTNFYILGTLAETITIECCISNINTKGIKESYECQGWGCSEDTEIACSRALAEAMQGLAVAKAMENNQYGLANEISTKNGYMMDSNDFMNQVKTRQDGFINMRDRSTINEIDAKELLLQNKKKGYSLNELINNLRSEGYENIERYILTDESLPFSVVRLIIPELSCPEGL